MKQRLELLEQRVRDIIADQVRQPRDIVRDDMHVGNDLGADSLDQTEMLLAFEHEFGLRLESPGSGLSTVRQLIELVTGAMQAQHRGELEQGAP